MPVFPEIKVEMPRYCNLRQVLQWLGDDLQPIDPQFEPALGHPRFDVKRDYSEVKSKFYEVLLTGQIKLLGRLGRGPIINHDGDLGISHYGDREEVPVTQIITAGLYGLNFESGELSKTTEWEDDGFSVGAPLAAWHYIELVIPTADLMRVFPPSNSVEIPITIELRSSDTGQLSTPAALPPRSLLSLNGAIERIADYRGTAQSEAATALYDALCGGELIAEAPNSEKVPTFVWRSFSDQQFLQSIETGITDWGTFKGLECRVDCIIPCLRTVDIDLWLRKAAQEAAALERWPAEDDQPVEQPQADQPTAEGSAPVGFGFRESEGRSPCDADSLSRFVQFLIEMAHRLGGRDCIDARRKEKLQDEIKAQWRPELLGPSSENKIGMMATFLRSPEAQEGGAKPTRAAGSGTSSEG